MTDVILALLFLGAMTGWLVTYLSNQTIRNVIQAAVDKAELDRRGEIRIPLNQVLAWGYSSRHGIHREAKEFNKISQTRHPSTLRAPRRVKL